MFLIFLRSKKASDEEDRIIICIKSCNVIFCCVMLKSFRLIQMLTCNALKENLEDKKLEENNNG